MTKIEVAQYIDDAYITKELREKVRKLCLTPKFRLLKTLLEEVVKNPIGFSSGVWESTFKEGTIVNARGDKLGRFIGEIIRVSNKTIMNEKSVRCRPIGDYYVEALHGADVFTIPNDLGVLYPISETFEELYFKENSFTYKIDACFLSIIIILQ